MSANLPQSQQKAVSATTAGSPDVLVAAVTGKRIVVVSAVLSSSVAGTATLQGHSSGLNMGVLNFPAPAAALPIVLDYHPDGWFSTASGESLDMAVTGSTNTVSGSINYVLM